MNKKRLTEYFKELYPAIYSFSFTLVPEGLQAEQICLDALELLMVEEKKMMDQIVFSSPQEAPQLLQQLRRNYFKHICYLGVKRFDHLKGSLEVKAHRPQGDFFTLSVLQRGVLFLKTRLKFDLGDIEFITGSDRYEVLSHLAKARDGLLQTSQGRSITVPSVIGD